MSIATSKDAVPNNDEFGSRVAAALHAVMAQAATSSRSEASSSETLGSIAAGANFSANPVPLVRSEGEAERVLQNALASSMQRQLLSALPPVSSLLPSIASVTAPSPLLATALQQAQLLSLAQALQGAATAPVNLYQSQATQSGPHLSGDSSGASQLLASQSVMSTQRASSSNALFPSSMQSWSAEHLEQHVATLHRMNQRVPQSVSMLLAEARRKQDKKNAKRLANRKSASTSRARKKALLKEMTELNARLKRQALILALIPDLVIVIDMTGTITFCSAQVKRILRHATEDLVGEKLVDILVPSSKEKFLALLTHHNDPDKERQPDGGTSSKRGSKRGRSQQQYSGSNDESKQGDNGAASIPASFGGDVSSDAAAVVSEPSFPLSVVKVNQSSTAGCEDVENSDTSGSNGGGKQGSSLTNSDSLHRSPTASSLGNSGISDDGARKTDQDNLGSKKVDSKLPSGKVLPSSDLSNSSSASNNSKNIQKANQNLERNVRRHNKKIKYQESGRYKDDVIGAAVTANNASARLSSLQHLAESSEEDDSGYRESNDSREETSSTASDLSDSNVTSSIRSGESREDAEQEETSAVDAEEAAGCKESANPPQKCASVYTAPPAASEIETLSVPQIVEKEILLCLRPIRDGELVEESYRFVPADRKAASEGVSDDPNTATMSADLSTKSSSESKPSTLRPPKKRIRSTDAGCVDTTLTAPNKKKKGKSSIADSNEDLDSDVVESLILMSNKS